MQASFNEVNKAQQEGKGDQLANGDYNEAVPRARGEADQAIRGAEGYRFKRVNEAEGDAPRSTPCSREYVKAPEVTRTRLYLETMGDVLPAAGEKIIIDDKHAKPVAHLAAQQMILWRRNERARLLHHFSALVLRCFLRIFATDASSPFIKPNKSSSLSSASRR